ncbi:MAG TPA: serine/threonine-protein kinase [Terracidiphilus sp.]|jgi:serine/threonine-protein kinase|nr:serine/threonine-protein kinase [Terracidiphilus sp.]
MAFEPGQRIGDYEVVARLGAGGLGVVYEVQHLISQRREAMKILLPDQSGTPEMVERFRREVQTLATLNHVNIAQLHTAFYHENQLAMIMELIQGETLRDLRARTAITLPQALDYIAQTLNALAYAHRLGVVHRDIKPSNVMITDGGFVKLLDFGIAITGHGSDLTRAGYLLGSLNYMSPEQVGGSKATSRSDLYSVGVTLYELLTGELPIKGENNYEVMMGHINQIPIPPHHIAPLVPVVVSDAVMRALAKDPMQRFATADDFLHSLKLTPATSQEGDTYAAPLPTMAAPATSGRTPMPPPAVPQVVSGPPPLSSVSAPPVAQKSQSSSGLQSLPLEDISRKLAVYIGPVAKFVIKKLAAQSEDIDFIFREAAKQIPSDTDRAAFLRSRRN